MRQLLMMCIILIPLTSISQVLFKEGYFINKRDQEISCLLMNPGVEGKGESYIYKIRRSDSPKNFDISLVKEFGIKNEVKFVREEIEINFPDKSVSNKKTIGKYKKSEKGYAFLNELINSDIATLYSFYYEGRKFFFYRIGDSKLVQLVFDEYNIEVSPGIISEVVRDNTFKEQLKIDLPCSIPMSKVYFTQKSLVKYFQTYISEKGAVAIKHKIRNKSMLNFKIGISASNVKYNLSLSKLSSINFDEKTMYGMGGELEYLFSFNRNKLGLFMEFNYHMYKNSQRENINSVTELNYNFWDLPMGFVYNINLTSKSKVFVKLGYVPSFVSESSYLTIHTERNKHNIRSTSNLMFAAGFTYGKFGLEIRKSFKRNMTQHIYQKGSDFEFLSVRLVYSPLGLKF